MDGSDLQLVGQIRSACTEAAGAAYEDAGLKGLCAEGRWEYVVTMPHRLDLAPIVEKQRSGDSRRHPEATHPT